MNKKVVLKEQLPSIYLLNKYSKQTHCLARELIENNLYPKKHYFFQIVPIEPFKNEDENNMGRLFMNVQLTLRLLIFIQSYDIWLNQQKQKLF